MLILSAPSGFLETILIRTLPGDFAVLVGANEAVGGIVTKGDFVARLVPVGIRISAAGGNIKVAAGEVGGETNWSGNQCSIIAKPKQKWSHGLLFTFNE